MSRVNWSLSEGQVKKIKEYCEEHSASFYERPGFIWRHIVHSISSLLSAGLSIDEIRSGADFLVDLHRYGIDIEELKKRVFEE